MKKTYSKPYLAVESFQLNAAIAGACSGKITLGHSVDACHTHDRDNKGGVYLTNVPFFGAACANPSNVPNGIDVTLDTSCYQAMSMSDQFLTS